MTEYLKEAHGSLNLLVQAVLSDLKVPQYAAGCRALGIIDWTFMEILGALFSIYPGHE